MTLSENQIFKIVQKSLEYIKDGKSDLDLILTFAAQIWGNKNIISLFE